MSRENLEITRRMLEHINRTGQPPLELLDPGVTVEQPVGWVARVRQGLIVSGRVYFRQSEALEATGLSQ
jgi:hypothetical protein